LLALRAHCQRRCALRGLPALTVAAMEPRPSRQAMLALHRYISKSCLGSLVVTEFVIKRNTTRRHDRPRGSKRWTLPRCSSGAKDTARNPRHQADRPSDQ
jgi:hypothetical protein